MILSENVKMIFLKLNSFNKKPNKAFKQSQNTLHLLWVSLRSIFPQKPHPVLAGLTRR